MSQKQKFTVKWEDVFPPGGLVFDIVIGGDKKAPADYIETENEPAEGWEETISNDSETNRGNT